MAPTVFAVAASSWAVVMGLAPLLQIRRMLRERSSREVSVGYFAILLIGFLLWISYGAVAGILALVIPNTVALVAGAAVIVVALRLRRRTAANSPQPTDLLSGFRRRGRVAPSSPAAPRRSRGAASRTGGRSTTRTAGSAGRSGR